MAHKAHGNTSKKGTVTAKVTPTSKCSGGTKGKAIPKGTTISIDKTCKSNKKYHVSTKKYRGWISQSAVKLNTKKTAQSISKSQTKKNNKSAKKSVKAAIKSMKLKGNGSASVKSCYVNDITGIYGAPYGFIERTDARWNPKGQKKNNVIFGRKYVERIMSKMPVLLLTPGQPNFAPDMGKKDINNLVKSLLNTIKGDSNMYKNLFKENNMRYYSFKFAYTSYFKYVNAMLRYSAIALGIGNKTWPQSKKKNGKGKQKMVKLKSFKWGKSFNAKLSNVIGSANYIAFYIDSETSISETFSNSTTQSALAGTVDSLSSTAKELQFLAGPIAGLQIAQLNENENKAAFDAKVDQISEKISKHIGFSKLISNVGEGVKTVAKGGHLIFPEIWDESSFDRSYSVSLKLRTPSGDKLSWFINIMVPLAHLICLTAPRNLDANSYQSPFLIRAYYKGIFNVDMGLITSMSVTKGRESAWTVDGLPTEIDISLDIKELYSTMSISDTTGLKMFRNYALVDYLSNLCGINVNEPDLARIVEVYTAWSKNKISDLFSNGWTNVNESMANWVLGAYDNSLMNV